MFFLVSSFKIRFCFWHKTSTMLSSLLLLGFHLASYRFHVYVNSPHPTLTELQGHLVHSSAWMSPRHLSEEAQHLCRSLSGCLGLNNQSFSSYPVSHIQSTLKSSWLCLQNSEDADGSHHLPGFHSCPCVVLHSPPSWFLLLPLALSVFCRPSNHSDPCDESVRPCHCAVRLLG